MDLFCKIINGEIPSKTYYEDDLVKVILDISPHAVGHSLIIPKKHITDVCEIDNESLAYVYKIALKVSDLLKERLDCDGFSYTINYDKTQDIKHFHLHIIPHYSNEINLSIDEVFEKLK